MANPKMGTSPGTPTARKAPSTPQSPASASSKVSAKRKQQPKPPGSQPTPGGRQRKQSMTSRGPVQTDNKRKMKNEEESMEMASPKPSADAYTATETIPTTPKKQRIDMGVQDRPVYQPSPGHLPTAVSPFALSSPARQQQQLASMSATQLTGNLLHSALKRHPYIVPQKSAAIPITSSHITEIAHRMWQLAFENPGVLDQVCSYAAAMSHIQLATLAKLGYLPSWWYLRESVVVHMTRQQWIVDDTTMRSEWLTVLGWCRSNLPRAAPKPSVDGVQGTRGENGEVIVVEDE
ncbi:hypothetical protein IAQ61_011360 [Plenodomus lingam]|uniref:Predicted protein n=1 Tax=Leptosphaeria maculans (strain JN3 / isolate v23.1.3 / race Av1-4-5-6-7-8) TaxID=985895 RepID=E5A9U2_LEPMJ|nr:predicted protein [Plenodomus lingam JN3]KAH9859579.1 hypothetical protein IAQ61_011360 [Plenodomus lingam]CBY00433.1 predicted protein [Plenodomus lingam JN3]